MKYLFLMFFKYYREGKNRRDIAYFSALSAVVLYVYMLFLFIISLLGIDFSIKGIGKSRLQDYIIMGGILFPIYLGVYFIYPPLKIKKYYKNFKNNKIINILIIMSIIGMFIMISANKLLK